MASRKAFLNSSTDKDQMMSKLISSKEEDKKKKEGKTELRHENKHQDIPGYHFKMRHQIFAPARFSRSMPSTASSATSLQGSSHGN